MIMDFINNFHFLRPWFLLLLIIPAVFYFILFKNDENLSSWEKVCDKKLLDFLLIKGNNRRRKFSVFLIYAGLIFSVLATAGPTWQKEEQPFLVNNNPVMILLNLSTDMQQTDISPNRLTRAKMEIISLLEQKALADAESGLIVYTAEPFMVSPLSNDAGLIANLLPAVDVDIMPLNGDRPDRAIDMAVEKIKAAGYTRGSVVLFGAAAGTDLKAALSAAGKAAAAGININTVNVSTESNAGLAQIARAGGGLAVSSASVDMSRLVRHMTEKTINDKKESMDFSEIWKDFGYYLLFIPLLCCLYFFRRGLLVMAFICLISSPASAGFFLNDNQEAMKFYEKGEYEKAAGHFKDEQWQASSWYQAGDYVRAADLFAKAKDVEGVYNYGNALAKSGDIGGAIKQYEEVLKQNPDHEDAKYNLEYLKQQQKQQQQQQQKQNESQQDNQNQDNKRQNSDSDRQEQEQSPQNQQQNAAQNDSSASEQEQQQSPSPANSEESEEQNQSRENSETPQGNKQNPSQTAEMRQQPAAPAKEGAKDEQYDEEAQARAQRFREIPEDKGGLLRAFIYKEYMKNRYGG